MPAGCHPRVEPKQDDAAVFNKQKWPLAGWLRFEWPPCWPGVVWAGRTCPQARGRLASLVSRGATSSGVSLKTVGAQLESSQSAGIVTGSVQKRPTENRRIVVGELQNHRPCQRSGDDMEETESEIMSILGFFSESIFCNQKGPQNAALLSLIYPSHLFQPMPVDCICKPPLDNPRQSPRQSPRRPLQNAKHQPASDPP
jgi:hypothetical protein